MEIVCKTRLMWVLAILNFATIICIFSSCGVHKIYQYARYCENIEKQLPDSFKVEVPMKIYEGRFSLYGLINQKKELFIIDTGAEISLASEEMLKDFHATFWGSLPIKSVNVYGQKKGTNLYFPNSLNIQELYLGKPLFQSISMDNYIYSLLENPIIGEDILKMLYWKFSMDNSTITLFNKKNTYIFENETKDFTKIKMSISRKSNITVLPIEKTFEAILDLGSNGEIRVNKKTFEELNKSIFFSKYIQLRNINQIDTLYLSQNININWEGVDVENCRIAYTPGINYNLIGSRFMQRFNFLLALKDFKKEIYIKQRDETQQIINTAYFSDFGFDINKQKELLVTPIEIGGLAEKAGLKLGDIVLSIDNNSFDLEKENRHDRLIAYLHKKERINMCIKRNDEIINLTIDRKGVNSQ